MKILIVSQRYWPENFRITDIAETLVQEGHDVTVLTGLPNYPEGYVYPDYRHGENRNQVHNGVKIVRVKEIGRRHNILFRFVNYYSFPFFANRMVKKLDKDFDVVLINELSPIMAARPGIKYAKKYGVRCVMYEMDLWPHSLLAGGISENSFLYKHYRKVSAKIYSGCDEILVSTKEHIEEIHKLPGCDNLPIHYLPQYAESIFEESSLPSVDNGVIDLMFAGNIGLAQSCETIIEAARILKDDSRFLFHIVGDGTDLPRIKKMAESYQLKNVVFYGRQPLVKMPELYALADVMLVTLEDKPYARMTIPGKVQSYMACGKPIIGAVSGATSRFVIEADVGWCVDSGDAKALAKSLVQLSSKGWFDQSQNARDFYLNNMKKSLFFSCLLKHLYRENQISEESK